MKYRIIERHYACFDDGRRMPVLQTEYTAFVVQMRKWYGWTDIKEFEYGEDTDFARIEAEELLEMLENRNGYE